MCGIVGYVGPRPAADILLEGLRRMEYRGYDSAGLAVIYTILGAGYWRHSHGFHMLILVVAAIACYACPTARRPIGASQQAGPLFPLHDRDLLS